jgi:hypothetical protein
MSLLAPGSYVPIALWVSIACPHCEFRFTRRVGACLEPLVTPDGDFLGLEGVLRFERCGHQVPGAQFDAVALAHLMNDIEDNAREWHPAEDFDPNTVEIED